LVKQVRDWEPLAEAMAVFAFVMADIWWLHWHNPFLAMVVLAWIVASHAVAGWALAGAAFPRLSPR
jgi:hypothetical protein